MIFYDPTNSQGINSEIDRLCDSNDTAFPRLDKTAYANQALEELVAEAINAAGVWEYDDTNYTDLPKGTATLVEGQESYTFASQYLKVKRVKVKDVNGRWRPLKQVSEDDFDAKIMTIEQYYGLDNSGNPIKGIPLTYLILGDSIRLYPSPTATQVTLTNGLQVEFYRTAQLFTATSGTTADTTSPGLPSPFHNLLAYYAAIRYCVKYKQERVGLYQKKWDDGVVKLIKYYATRNPDRRKIMKPKKIKFI